MKAILLSLTLLMALPANSMASDFDHSHVLWTQVLGSYLDSSGMFKYKDLKGDLGKNKNHPFLLYIASLEKVKKSDYDLFSRHEQMAYLINAYNALTIKLIVDHYPVNSIRRIGGLLKKPWRIEFFNLLDGGLKALDPIEHEWLRPHFKDYRIHAAVNCASYSCPPLRRRAFTAEHLDNELDDQMQVWLKDSERNQFDPEKNEVRISKIFDWYRSDFDDWGEGLINVIKKYAPEKHQSHIKSDTRIRFLSYDWKLNEP